jgi:mono/diheme cytochrome c family protein
MKKTGQTRQTKGSQKRKAVRVTPAQIGRQAGLIVIVVVVWSLLLVGYLALFGPGGASAAATPEPTQAVPTTAAATEVPAGTTAPAGAATVSFSADVLPIFGQYCQRCHGATGASAGVNLSSYDSVMTGSRRTIVVPGNSGSSTLVQVIRTGRMPQGGPKLSDAEIQTIATWIDEGAPDN